jgi:hypothetical protein
MAARPGEENVATLFGDIHYFYGPENVKPRHHRFDKGSYVYLFENARESNCRIEVANHPGTEDQDAFDGLLDQAKVRYSYKHHCMVSLTVADNVDQSQWHLPTYDPRNENKYHYKLHSLDIYFWTQRDALQFVNGVRRVLPASQVEVLDEPAPPPQPAGMSSVVQRLEKVAVSDPSYGHAGSSAAGHAQQQQQQQHGFAGPPVSAVAPNDASAQFAGSPAPASIPGPPASFVPMAYNPAAPAAPETIRHREKTPPPDEDPLNPLSVAVAYDYQRQPFTPGPVPPSQFPPLASPGLPPQGLASPGFPPQFAGPPQHPGVHRAATVQGLAPMPSPGLSSPYGGGGGMPPPPPQSQSQPQPQPQSQPSQLPPPPGPAPGPAPATAPASNTPAPSTSPPPGGFSNYSYAQSNQARPGAQDYSIHHQLYRPTESEMVGTKPQPYEPKKEPRGRLEENAGRLERGVSGMFKKFEKKFG